LVLLTVSVYIKQFGKAARCAFFQDEIPGNIQSQISTILDIS